MLKLYSPRKLTSIGTFVGLYVLNISTAVDEEIVDAVVLIRSVWKTFIRQLLPHNSDWSPLQGLLQVEGGAGMNFEALSPQ